MTNGENANSDKGNTDVWTRIESTLDRIVQMQEETSRQIAEMSSGVAEMNKGGIDWDRIAQLQEETARQIAEMNNQSVDWDRIAQMQEETSRQIAEMNSGVAEMNNGGIDWDRLEQMQEENARMISELGKNIGGLHNKFGDFTEDLAIASIERILEEDFKVNYSGDINMGHLKDVGRLQVDAFGVAKNGVRAVYLVEVKSKFESKHIEQVCSQVRKFRKYFPQFENWGVYPVIAAVQITKKQRTKVWASGVYLIEVSDGVFRLGERPDKFRPDGTQGIDEFRRDVPQFHMLPGGLTENNKSGRST